MASAANAVNFVTDDVHNLEPLVTREQIRETIRKGLNLYVGRGRRYSVEELSAGAGVPKRAIEAAKTKIDDENYRPLTLENLASLAKFLKAPFVSIYLEASGLGAFELMDAQPPLPRTLTSVEPSEAPEDERKRLIRRLAELEGVA
jgi:hypothetical protein